VRIVRAEAVGKPIILDPTLAFVVMRFSQNDENDNTWRYGIKAGLTNCGFTAFRADDRVESMQIFEQIYRNILRSRIVVAKVDEQNLNVYFELGLAMGLGKDVLLVSESTLIINLPTDLNNWECLTYDRGNYEQLNQKIQNFLVQNYRAESGAVMRNKGAKNRKT
jgi:nucleoside 2-deoxyribosyltransferase